MLELLEVLEYKGRHIEEGEISIGFDHKIECKKIVSPIRRISICAQELGAEISRIKDLLQKIKFEAKIKFVKGHAD